MPESVDDIVNLAHLLRCATTAQLKATWLSLTDAQRANLRPSRALAHYAWSLIIRDRVLRPQVPALPGRPPTNREARPS